MANVSVQDIADLFANPPDVKDQVKLDASLKGYADLKKQMAKFAPDLKRAMDKEIRAYLKPVITDAKSMVPSLPLSGWRQGSGRGKDNGNGKLPNWDQGTVSKGIVVRQGQKKKRKPGEAVVSSWELRNSDGAGSAFEGMGRKGGGRTDSGRRMIAAMTLYHGARPRLLWRAWGDAGGDAKLQAGVLEIIHRREAELSLRLAGISSTKG